MVLDTLFGNSTAAKVLLFMANNRDAYAQEIASATGYALSMVQRQLRRLEYGGVIVSRPRGRMRFYEFNPRFAQVGFLKDALQDAFDDLSDEDREKLTVRARPRAQGKKL